MNDTQAQKRHVTIASGDQFIRKYQVLGIGQVTDVIEVTNIGRSAWLNSRMVHVRPVGPGYGGGCESLRMGEAIDRIQSGKWLRYENA